MKYNGSLISLVTVRIIVVLMVGLHYTLHHMVVTLRSFNYSLIKKVLILMKVMIILCLVYIWRLIMVTCL